MYNPVDEFGNQVRQRREERGLTQRKLAEHLGLSYRTVLQAETHKSNPKLETVVILAKELGISIDALVFRDAVLPNSLPKCVYDFFKDKTPADAERFISILMNLEELQKSKKDK